MAQLTGLHAKFTGDASGLAAATTKAIGLLDQYGRSFQKVETAQEKAAAATKQLESRFHKLKMETDNAYAGMTRFKSAAELTTRVAQEQKWSAEQLGAELTRLANHYGVAEQAGLTLNQQIRSSRFHTANLAAQFNDIGVMMASGQSPFILAVQQGTQISQVLQAMGGTAREQFKSLGDAIRATISPTSLLTIGLIAGTAALVQWGMEAYNAKEETKTLQDHIDALTAATNEYVSAVESANMSSSDLVDKYGVMAAAAREALSAFALAERAAQLTATRVAVQALVTEFENLTSYVEDWQTGGIVQEFSKLSETLQLSEADTIKLYQGLIKLQTAKGPKDVAAAAQELSREMEKVYGSVDAMPAAALKLYNELQQIILRIGEAEQATAKLAPNFLAAFQAAQNVAASTQSIGTAALGSIAGVQALGKALWNLAQQRQAANNALAAIAFGNSPGGQLLNQYGGRGAPNSAQSGLAKGFDMFGNPIVKDEGGGGGGGSQTDPLEAELERLRQMYATQAEIQLEAYAEQQRILEEALQQRLITQEEYARLMQQVESTHQFKMGQEARAGVSETLSALGQLFQGSKAFGAGVALVNAWLAFSEALKDPKLSPWQRFAAAAKALAAGMNAVRNIKSASPGGGGSSGSAGSTAAQAAPPQPLQATLNLQGPFASALSGALGPLLEGLTKEAGDRGYQLMVKST